MLRNVVFKRIFPSHSQTTTGVELDWISWDISCTTLSKMTLTVSDKSPIPVTLRYCACICMVKPRSFSARTCFAWLQDRHLTSLTHCKNVSVESYNFANFQVSAAFHFHKAIKYFNIFFLAYAIKLFQKSSFYWNKSNA